MNFTRTLAVVAMAAALAVTACKKDDITPVDPNNPGGGSNTNNPPAPTKTSKLVEKQWKIQSTRMIEDGQSDTANINIVGADTWRFTFRADRTGTAVGTFLATQAAPSPDFNWVFNNDSTFVTLTTAGGRSASYRFTDSTLVRSVPNLTLTLVNSQGQPVGQVTGTLLESFNKVN